MVSEGIQLKNSHYIHHHVSTLLSLTHQTNLKTKKIYDCVKKTSNEVLYWCTKCTAQNRQGCTERKTIFPGPLAQEHKTKKIMIYNTSIKI